MALGIKVRSMDIVKERLSDGGYMAFTMAPNNKFQMSKQYEMFKLQAEYISDSRKGLHRCADYYINYEITDNGRGHWHGIVKINDKIKWFKSVKPYLDKMGYMLLKPMKNDINGWIDYMFKDYQTTQIIIETDPMLDKNRSEFRTTRSINKILKNYPKLPLDKRVDILKQLSTYTLDKIDSLDKSHGITS